MISGVGIDIIEVSRVAEKISREGFKAKVFSAVEIAYCDRQADPAQHYAARFAAKEAFLKATGLGMNLTFDLCRIEIVNLEKNRPGVLLHPPLDAVASDRGWNSIHISLSHIRDAACAVVIIES